MRVPATPRGIACSQCAGCASGNVRKEVPQGIGRVHHRCVAISRAAGTLRSFATLAIASRSSAASTSPIQMAL
jgi:hypothetical protein